LAYFKEKRSNVESIWETTRMIVWSSFQSQSKKRINPKTFMPFDWDKKPTSKEKALTKEEMTKIINKFEIKKAYYNGD
jgi:hypothetical protein